MMDMTGDLPTCHTLRLEAHQNRVTGCVYSEKCSILASSGQDGTVRMWDFPKSSSHRPIQTCIFTRNEGDDDANSDSLDAHLLTYVCWSPSGRSIAGAMDTMINIWSRQGTY